jgi:hypothetical protein
VDAAGAQLDEAQHLQPPSPDRVDGQEIAGDDVGGLLAQDHPPSCSSPTGRRVQSVAAQRGADRSRRDSYTRSLELALDALVAPARVLCGETDDQLLDLVVKRSSPLSMMRVGPSPGDEAAVPAQQCLRLHQEARPAPSRQCPADRREQRTVGGSSLGRWT